MHGSLSLRPALALGASLADQAYQLIKDDLFSFRCCPASASPRPTWRRGWA